MDLSRSALCPRLAAGAIIVFGTCAATPINDGKFRDCKVSKQIPGARAGLAMPTVGPSPPGHQLVLSFYFTLEGTCARTAKSFHSGSVFLPNNRRMDIKSDGRVSFGKTFDYDELFPRLPRVPVLEGTKPYFLDTVNPASPEADATADYVGVWKLRGQFIVASFSTKAREPVGSPRILFRSKLPIVSVDYFPAPDTAAGNLGVIQRVTENRVRLLNYDWRHPGL